MPDDTFREFPAFSRAFQPSRRLKVGAYLVLLNLTEQAAEAVRLVASCLDSATDAKQQVSSLLRGEQGWRPQLVGCAAVLAMEPHVRPLDELQEAVCRGSWVGPQLLATLSLVGGQHWSTRVERCIVDLGDAKSAAALHVLTTHPGPALVELAARDDESGDGIARGWRAGIRQAFDDAGQAHSW